ncbi:MAG TPA: F0F1 ATP synthase subunit epsilon [Saprospiraceae bacterium]|nr:F0F1 ATP synthase subunit epsilon [Saprospiraceae bacterium]
MQLTVLSPVKEIYSGEAKSVSLPGLDGSFQLLNNHAPIVAALGAGRIKVESTSGEVLHFDIVNGFVEMLNNKTSLLVEESAQEK